MSYATKKINNDRQYSLQLGELERLRRLELGEDSIAVALDVLEEDGRDAFEQ
jgi:hypothetical protein